ncbi:hypothetical protein R3W88_003693 [Solanum pinnatisectum]|uniref:Plant bHLH transcription factor ACT-like domain-containing protein n=1 Tax=Solanum pinnatisectum TaxID=50273 RepID=A0AAV9MQD4_9SOLN|nr:hypothetical protein R3W88_003693 [Solanum pinnatisectum]
MNEGGENDHDLYADVWSYLDWNDHQVGSGETFKGNKLLDPTRSDTCQPLSVINEVVEVSVDVAKKRSPPNRKKNGKGIAKPNFGADGAKRKRRKKMRTLFEILHALVPNLPAKIWYSLDLPEEYSIRLMSSQKVGNSWEKYVGDQGSTCNSTAITPTNHGASPLIPTGFMTWNSPNVILNVCGEAAHISVCCPKKSGLFTIICYVLEKHKIDIMSAQISSDQFRDMFMIQVHAKGESEVAQFSGAIIVEDMYKQVANEIMLLTSPK